MFTYHSSTGQLVGCDGKVWGFGFAGNGVGLNNPAAEGQHNIGPIPIGKYKLLQYFPTHGTVGACAIALIPEQPDKYGRSGFFIHGSTNLTATGLDKFLHSSDGCIVLGDCALRLAIWKSGDLELQVVA